jgi:hypothetical protein
MQALSILVTLTIAMLDGGTLNNAPPFQQPSPDVIAGERLAGELRILSKQQQVAFVVEGEPVEQPVDKRQFQRRPNESRTEMVSRLADGYGYAAEKAGNVYILKKLYRAPDDVPDITIEELLHSLRMAAKVFASFNPKMPTMAPEGYPVALDILATLSPKQMEVMSNGQLPVTSLSQPQRAEMWKIAKHLYVQRVADEVDTGLAQCELASRGNAAFFHKQFPDTRVFGYEYQSASGSTFMPADSYKKMLVAIGVKITNSVSNHNGIITQNPEPDDSPCTPVPERAKDVVTLRDAVSHLPATKEDNYKYSVDPIIEDKTVIMIGADMAPRQEFVRAISSIYGLRLKQDGGEITLTVRGMPAVKDIGTLADAIRQTLPSAVFRSLYAHAHSIPAGREHLPAIANQVNYSRAGGWLRQAATNRVRALIEPKAPLPHGNVLISSLESRLKMTYALALLCMSGIPSTVEFSERPVPDYITDFNHAILTGGTHLDDRGKRRMNFFIAMPDPKTGDWRNKVGFMDGRLER